MIKKWIKRILITIFVLLILFFVCFEKVEVNLVAQQTAREEYSGWYLFEWRRIYYSGFIKMPGNAESESYLIMFRGGRDRLIEKVISDINKDLAAMKEKYSVISETSLDENTGEVLIYVSVSEQSSIYREIVRHTIDINIERRCELLYELRNPNTRKEWGDGKGGDVKIIVALNKGVLHKEEPEIETKKYVYDEKEIDLLKEIVSRSLNKDSFDFSDEDKIKGDSEDETGGHICYLDLSDYNYITGKIDLSGFSKLKYILLRGMKISEVVLPESLEYIDEKSFAYCESLEKIIIPKNVKSLENPVFYGCKSLKEIVFEGDAPEVSWKNEDIFGKVPQDLIIYRKKSAKGWQEKCWDKYDVRIMEE